MWSPGRPVPSSLFLMTSSCQPMTRTGPSASSCWGLPWSPGWQVWRPEMKLITNFCVSCNISNHWKEMVAGGPRGALHWRLAAPVLCSERRHAAHRTVDFPISSEHFLYFLLQLPDRICWRSFRVSSSGLLLRDRGDKVQGSAGHRDAADGDARDSLHPSQLQHRLERWCRTEIWMIMSVVSSERCLHHIPLCPGSLDGLHAEVSHIPRL